MFTDNHLVIGSLLISLLLIWTSQEQPESYYQPNPQSIILVNKEFKVQLQDLEEQGADFQKLVDRWQSGDVDTSQLIAAYQTLRQSFKSIGFLLEYLDKEAYDKALNGAPLPKLEKKVADLNVLEPRGLQVIDELIGSGLVPGLEDAAELQRQVGMLANQFQKFNKYLVHRRISDRQFLEGSAQALVRIGTLGITGFDTPGTHLGIQDAAVVLASLKNYYAFYELEMQQVKGSALWEELMFALDRAALKCQEARYDSFDRLDFFKNDLHPLLGIIKEVHLILDYETIAEVSRFPLAVNEKAVNLFDPEFLNKFYYISVPNDSMYEKVSQLGKLLFYDPVLSSDSKMSCASCHAPERAFTDGLETSNSNSGLPLKRNALTLNYSGYASAFFHDLRTKRLEDQFEHVVVSQDEFASTYPKIIAKLETSDEYKKLFEDAFPKRKRAISSNTIDYALAAYVMDLATFDNRIDRYMRNEAVKLTPSEKRGFNLFTGKANCASCHFLPLFSGLVPPQYNESEAEVLGVPQANKAPWVLDDDIGRLGNGRTQEVAQFYHSAFKTPTIRNIDLTAPYMHNGVFESLEEVMDFYNEGGGVGRGMQLQHQTLAPDPLGLTEAEITDIIHFMKALSDETTFQRPEEIPRDFKSPALNERILIQ